MLRTNCKEVKQRVQKYLLDCAREGLTTFIEENPGGSVTIQDIEQRPMQTVDKFFNCEVHYDILRYGHQKAFSYWINSAFGVLPCTVYNEERRKLIQQWLDETDAESMKYDDFKVNELFVYLCYREYNCLLKNETRRTKK